MRLRFLNNGSLDGTIQSVVIAFAVGQNRIRVAVRGEQSFEDNMFISQVDSIDKLILRWIIEFQDFCNVKVVAAGVGEAAHPEKLGEPLWLIHDIVPFFLRGRGPDAEARATELAERLTTQINKKDGLDVPVVNMTTGRRIQPAVLTTLEAYKDVSRTSDFNFLQDQVARFRGLEGNILFLNSTPQGGGVALMRHALLRLFRLMNVSAEWSVLLPRAEVFEITKKKFHNVLQGVAPEGIRLTEEDKEVYRSWIADNIEELKPVLNWANVIFIDDWQPSGLIKEMYKINPKIKTIFRSHIHIDTSLFKEGSPQVDTWSFVWDENRIKDCDVFISHPINEFIPDIVPLEKIVLMPASTDSLDGLNKPLSKSHMQYYTNIFNAHLERTEQVPLNLSRPYIAQKARFDPSKGIPDVLECYRLLRSRCTKENIPLEETPQLVLMGHGAIDDPEGEIIYKETQDAISRPEFEDVASDIKLARLPHCDQILSAVVQGSHVMVQLSHKEGCEVNVSEALFKGKPIIIYDSGGMHLQTCHQENAFVVECGNVERVASHIYDLLYDKELYIKVSRAAVGKVNPDFFTVRNAYKCLFIANELLEKGELKGQGKNLNDIIKQVCGHC